MFESARADPDDDPPSHAEAEAGSDPVYEAERLAGYEIRRLRAENPGPFTLSGTNTWIIGDHPAYVVDPGPQDERHLSALLAAIRSRGGLGGIALTHDHQDHCEALGALLEHYPAPVAAARGAADVVLRDGLRFGPLLALSTPGHTRDHFAFATERACFTGDAVLGEGSVFVGAYPGAMAGYMNGLARLATLDVDVLCPGHGPPIWDPEVKLEEYIAHRYDRENRLLVALSSGLRSVTELLDDVWSDVPAELRLAALVTLEAHLDKLDEEGLLAPDVERPQLPEDLEHPEH